MAERRSFDPVKRLLRQEAAFGCCKCGFPIGVYHHIIPHATEALDRPEHMVFLCRNHHDLADSGMVSHAEQYQWKKNPANKKLGSTSGRIINRKPHIAMDVGAGNWMIGDRFYIIVEGSTVFSIERNEVGSLDISLSMYDRNGHLAGIIDKNEWIVDTESGKVWDLEVRWYEIILRSKFRNVDIHINTKGEIMHFRGKMAIGNKLINFQDDRFFLESEDGHSTPRFFGMTLINLGIQIRGREIEFHGAPNGALFVAPPEPKQRLAASLQALEGIRQDIARAGIFALAKPFG